MISARGLVKTFGGFVAVDNFSFEVEAGEIYGLLGPNGAGKTTTTRLLTCLLRPTAGTALVAGHSIAAEPHRIRGKIGILTKCRASYEPVLTPDEYLMFFADIHEAAEAGRRARVEEMLRLVEHVGPARHRHAHVLEGHAATSGDRARPVARPAGAVFRRADSRAGSRGRAQHPRPPAGARQRAAADGVCCARTTFTRLSCCAAG